MVEYLELRNKLGKNSTTAILYTNSTTRFMLFDVDKLISKKHVLYTSVKY